MRDSRVPETSQGIWATRTRRAASASVVFAVAIGICIAFAIDLAMVEVASASPAEVQQPQAASVVPAQVEYLPPSDPGASFKQAVLAATTPPIGSRVTSTTRCPTGWFVIGKSIRGRPIAACKLGSGSTRMAVIGTIHGGWEGNTKLMTERFLNYFASNPSARPSALTVYFVPVVNPDGVAAGTGSSSAWNARGVDLNRNFDSGNWSRNTYGLPGGRYGPTGIRIGGGGTAPFSEPESRAIRDFVKGRYIKTVISYHSGYRSVSAKDGGGGIGEPIAKLIARLTGLPYIAKWTAYKLTGQLVDWANRVGVKGVDVDLPSRYTYDYSLHLSTLKAVMRYLVS